MFYCLSLRENRSVLSRAAFTKEHLLLLCTGCCWYAKCLLLKTWSRGLQKHHGLVLMQRSAKWSQHWLNQISERIITLNECPIDFYVGLFTGWKNSWNLSDSQFFTDSAQVKSTLKNLIQKPDDALSYHLSESSKACQ